MQLQQTWLQSSRSGFNFDKCDIFMGCKWSADWNHQHRAAKYSIIALWEFSAQIFYCLLPHSPSPVPCFCPSHRPVSYSSHVLVSKGLVYYVYHCFLSNWIFNQASTCTFSLEKAVKQSSAAGAALCISSSFVKMCGDGRQGWRLKCDGERTMEARQSEDVSVFTSVPPPPPCSASGEQCWMLERVMSLLRLIRTVVQPILCSCLGLALVCR